jgi:hypothetical protein
MGDLQTRVPDSIVDQGAVARRITCTENRPYSRFYRLYG